MTIEIHPATTQRWDDVRAIFGTRGGASWCSCQYFADPDWNRGHEANQDSLRHQIKHLDPPAGLLAYLDGEPVGWAQVGPSSRYPRFKPKGHQPTAGVWAITCFVIRVGYRGRGIATTLLHAAIDHARAHGATALRARPTDTSIARKSNAELYTGILSTFDRAGFVPLSQSRSLVLVELDLYGS